MLPIACPSAGFTGAWPEGIKAFACDSCLTWWLEETAGGSVCWLCGDPGEYQKSKIMFHWSERHRYHGQEQADQEFRYGVTPENLWD